MATSQSRCGNHLLAALPEDEYARLYPQHVAGLVAVDGPLDVRPFAAAELPPGFPPPLTGPEGRAARENMIRSMFIAETPPALQDHILKMMLADYKVEDRKFHIAGPSNGGIAAFHVAAANPQYFISVTAFPGYMWEPTTAKLQAISKMCVFMFVGENDEYRWHNEMKQEVDFLTAKGTVARYTVEKGQPHRLETLAGASAARLFDGFEETRSGCSK